MAELSNNIYIYIRGEIYVSNKTFLGETNKYKRLKKIIVVALTIVQ